MGFCRTFLALFVASVVAVSLMQPVAAYDPDPLHPNHTCVYACDPKGQHGCRDNCPICDPVQRRCVPKDGGYTPAPPPTQAPPPPTSAPSGKCMAVVVTKEEEHGVYVREKPTIKSAFQQFVDEDETIELTGMVTGEEYRGTNKWFEYEGGYVTGSALQFQNGGPSWCTVNGD